jgi:hypothetical protein
MEMVKLSSNPTCVLSDADVISDEQAERIAKVLVKHLPGANNVTEAGKIIVVDAEGDVSLVEDKTGSTYTAGAGLTLADGEFSVDNPLPGASGASENDVLTINASGNPQWKPQYATPAITMAQGYLASTTSDGEGVFDLTNLDKSSLVIPAKSVAVVQLEYNSTTSASAKQFRITFSSTGSEYTLGTGLKVDGGNNPTFVTSTIVNLNNVPVTLSGIVGGYFDARITDLTVSVLLLGTVPTP